MRIVLSLFLSLVMYALLGIVLPASAAEFNVVIDRNYTVESDGLVKVTEVHRVTNNSNNLLISKSNQETFQIPIVGSGEDLLQKSVDTAVVNVGGVNLPFTTVLNENFAELKVAYPSELRRGQTLTFTLTYTNFGLSEKSGSLIDIYAPGFVSDFNFTQGLTTVKYNTVYRISNQLPEINFVLPETASTEVGDNYTTISFSQESLLGRTIWIQLGRTQHYYFKISLQAIATDSNNTGYMNEYRMILPRDIDEAAVTQEVFFASINPEPFQVLEDTEGNLVGYFKTPSHITTEISVVGYARVSMKDNGLKPELVTRQSDLPTDLVSFYTLPAEYWEVDNEQIQEVASTLKGNETNVYKIVENTYDFVVQNIDYSEIKRFGINERQGALRTLNGGAAVCMEYSDLFLTLIRAQGIPARAAFGYGYDPKEPENAQEGHQWVEVYMPGIDSWVSVDVTWGENGRSLIGGDLNHFYTHVAGEGPNNPTFVERVSYGSSSPLDLPSYIFNAIEEIPANSTRTAADLLKEYPEVQKTDIEVITDRFINGFREFIFGTEPSRNGRVLVLAGIILTSGAILMLMLTMLRSKKTA